MPKFPPIPTLPEKPPIPISGKIRVGLCMARKNIGGIREQFVELEKQGRVEVIMTESGMDANRQLEQARQLISSGVHALVVEPKDSFCGERIVQMANESGTPVFTVLMPVFKGNIVSQVIKDFQDSGKKAAEYMAKEMNGKGKVLVLVSEDPYQIMCAYSFKGVFEKSRGSEVAKIAIVKKAGNNSESAISTLLDKYSDISGIFAVEESTAVKAINLLNSRNLKNIIVITQDGSAEFNQLMIRYNFVKCNIINDNNSIGYKISDAIMKFLEEGKEVPRVIGLDIIIFDRKTLKERTSVINEGEPYSQEKIKLPPNLSSSPPIEPLPVSLAPLKPIPPIKIKIKVGLCLPFKDYANVARAFAELEKKGLVETNFLITPDTENQPMEVKKFLQSGIQVLVIKPNGPMNANLITRMANQEKIPIFLLEWPADDGDFVTCISFDYKKMAEAAAEFMMKEIGGMGKILILRDSSQRDEMVSSSFRKTLERYPQIKVVETAFVQNQENPDEEISAHLCRHKDISGVFASSEPIALEAAWAIKSLNLKNVILVGCGAHKESIDAILKYDFFRGSILSNNRTGGPKVAKAFEKYIIERKEVPRFIGLDLLIVDKKVAKEKFSSKGTPVGFPVPSPNFPVKSQ